MPSRKIHSSAILPVLAALLLILLFVLLLVVLPNSLLDNVVRRKQHLAGHAEAYQQQQQLEQQVVDEEQSQAELEQNHDQQQQQQQQQQEQIHPLISDIKYWRRNTEFGERDNWRQRMKPCTLIERIQINEPAMISMGDALDALGGSLESNLREIVLAQNGILLLEEDTLLDQLDPMYVQYLNQSGDCYELPAIDSNSNNNLRFFFEPPSDDMSWFNPNNWGSTLNDDLTADYMAAHVPESHRIPCSDEVVVFGSKSASYWTILEGSERAETLTFKVNFRPSERMIQQQQQRQQLNGSKNKTHLKASVFSNGIRVSGVKIGNKLYKHQREFEQSIINSDSYKDILFQSEDEYSALKTTTIIQSQQDDNDIGVPSFNGNNDNSGQTNNEDRLTSPIVIDDSSILIDDGNVNICNEEAGCLCGNEDLDVMKVICSFDYNPMEPTGLPCNDPLRDYGYCNEICATIVTIHMDPIKFSERYLNHLLSTLKGQDEMDASGASFNIFEAARRVDYDKYVVTYQIVPDDESSHESMIGQDLMMAQALKAKLENAATRSFYGIRSINIKSSSDWKRSNRQRIFWLSLIVILPLAFFIYSRDVDDSNSIASASEQHSDATCNHHDFHYYIDWARGWLDHGRVDGRRRFGTMTSSERPILDETDSVMDHAGTIEMSHNLPEIALVQVVASKSDTSLISADGGNNADEHESGG